VSSRASLFLGWWEENWDLLRRLSAVVYYKAVRAALIRKEKVLL